MSHPHRLTGEDLPRLHQFWVEHWGGDFMVARGEIIRPELVEGFVVEDGREWVGLITFLVAGEVCEIVTLDSLREGQGIGSTLIGKALGEARMKKCRRIFLITTNDNLRALGFYQKRGFELVAVHCGAVNRSRKIEPSIPSVGDNGIPLRDEIELEMTL